MLLKLKKEGFGRIKLEPDQISVKVYNKSGKFLGRVRDFTRVHLLRVLNLLTGIRREELFVVVLENRESRCVPINHYYLGNRCRCIVSRNGIYVVSDALHSAEARFPSKFLGLPCMVVSRGEARQIITSANVA